MFKFTTKKKSTTASSEKVSALVTLQTAWRNLQSLDMQNYGTWPLAVKGLVIALVVLIITALAYALPISTKLDGIKTAEAEQEVLLESFKVKESKARHLDAYIAQVAQMETEFNQLLDQLPKDTRVSELVEGINKTGMGSGVRFQDISIESEIEKELFIEQPIRIAALGEYHQFGSFISGLAALPRIITLHNFEVINSKPTLTALPELTLIMNTKTYRSKDILDSNDQTSDNSKAKGE